MNRPGEVDQKVVEFAELVGAVDPITVVGGRTQWAVGGTPEPGTREVQAPAGIWSHEPEEMTVRCGAGTTLPPGGVAQLRPNTIVTNMLELLKIFCPDQPGAKSNESRALGRARGEVSQLLQNLDDKEAKAREDAERM